MLEARRRRRDRQLVVDRRPQRVAAYTTVYSAAKARRDRARRSPRRIEYGAEEHPRQRHLPGLHPHRDHGRTPRMDAGHPREGGAARGGQAARGGRGRGVPRVGPRVVRHRRDHPRRRRLGAPSSRDRQRADAYAARYAGTRSRGRGRAAAHRPRHLRRRHRAARDAARVLRAQPVRPRRASGASTRRRRCALPGVRAVFTAADLNPDVKEQWHTSIGPASPETPAPAAGRRRGALRRRPGRAGGRREPLPRRGRGRAGRRRLRAAPGGRRLHRGRGAPTRSCTRATARTSSARSAGLPAVGARRGVRRRRPRRRARRSSSRRTRRCRWKGAASSSTTPRPPASSRSTRRRSHRTRCGCSARGCSASPSTASGW